MEKVCQLLPHVSQSKVSVKKCASNTEKIVDKRQKDFREKKSTVSNQRSLKFVDVLHERCIVGDFGKTIG